MVMAIFLNLSATAMSVAEWRLSEEEGPASQLRRSTSAKQQVASFFTPLHV